MQKPRACRNLPSSIQPRRSTSSWCISAIWPLGPPKLMNPSRIQKRAASRKETDVAVDAGLGASAVVVFLEVVEVKGPEGLPQLPLSRVVEAVDQRQRAQDVDLRPVLVADRRLGGGDRLEEPPQEADIHVVAGPVEGAVVQLGGWKRFELLPSAHPPRS